MHNDMFNIEKIVKNIKNEMQKSYMKPSDLAKLCDWSNARVSNYLNLKRKFEMADLVVMADALKVSVHNLLSEDHSFAKWVKLPILRMDELIHASITQNKETHMLVVMNDEGRPLVAIKNEGNAMESITNVQRSVCDGDIVIFEDLTKSDRFPQHKDLVVVVINDHVKIRELNRDGSETWLNALNSDFPRVFFSKENMKIIGIVHRIERIFN